jgi:hypothetical protein
MRHCEYIKPNGEFCGSPALRGRDYCHWHLTFVARRLRAEKQEATADRTPLELPPFEDANSIQLSIMMVVDAILHDRIGPKKGNQLLYALQLASNNLKQGVNFQPAPKVLSDGTVLPVKTVRCTQYDQLELDFDIAEHAEQLKSTELPQPERSADPANNPWIDRYGAVPDHASTSEDEAAVLKKLDQMLRDTLLEASRSEDPQYRRDMVLLYLQNAPEAPMQAGRAAAPQKVLFPRKPPESVQQQWHEQRHANCTAEIDKAIADQEAARKKIS